LISVSGQGQTKASKRRETNGEQGPSPKKEAKKSPRKKSGSPSKGEGRMEVDEPLGSSPRKHHRTSPERIPKGGDSHDSGSIKRLVESPPKPKRTYEVEFIEPEKENVPTNEMDELNVSEIRNMDASHVNGHDSQILTPVKASDLNRAPQATSTPAPNGTLSMGRGRHSSGVTGSKLLSCFMFCGLLQTKLSSCTTNVFTFSILTL